MTGIIPSNVLSGMNFDGFCIYPINNVAVTSTVHTYTFSTSSRVIIFLLDNSMYDSGIIIASCVSNGNVTAQLISGTTSRITLDTNTAFKLITRHTNARPLQAIVFQLGGSVQQVTGE